MLLVYLERCSCHPFRLPHALRGYQMLEGLISASLNRPACVQLPKDLGNNSDDEALDEWEAWNAPQSSASSQSSNKIRRTPLRALSIFKIVSQLIQRLNTVLSTPSNKCGLDDAITELHQWMAGLPSYCTSSDPKSITPCVLNLSLVYNFARLTILRRQNAFSVSPPSIVKDVVRATLDFLSSYIEMSDFAHPMIAIFAKQAADCLKAMNSTNGCRDVCDTIERLRCIQDEFSACWSTSVSKSARMLSGIASDIDFALPPPVRHYTETDKTAPKSFQSFTNGYDQQQINDTLNQLEGVSYHKTRESIEAPSLPSTFHRDYFDEFDDFDSMLEELPPQIGLDQ